MIAWKKVGQSLDLTEEVNPLSVNPTKCSNPLKPFVAVADELFEWVWPFCGVAL